jgi:hypothetical protein
MIVSQIVMTKRTSLPKSINHSVSQGGGVVPSTDNYELTFMIFYNNIDTMNKEIKYMNELNLKQEQTI